MKKTKSNNTKILCNLKINLKGDVCEWFKQHAWKVCVL